MLNATYKQAGEWALFLKAAGFSDAQNIVEEVMDPGDSWTDSISSYQILDGILKYEGIIGYTFSILCWVRLLFENPESKGEG